MSMGRRLLGSLPLALILAGLATAVFLLGGDRSSEAVKPADPLTIEEAAHPYATRLTLTPRAVERLGVVTAPVRLEAGTLTAPAGGVMVDADGVYWVYEQAGPNEYLRRMVELERFAGGRALLADGPAPGARIVTAGAAELFGAEFGIGK